MTEKLVVRVLQHIEPEGPGLVADALRTHDVGVAVTRPDLGEPVPERLDGEVGLLVMGGPMGVYEVERHPYLAHEQRLIESALRAEVPVLGICLGSQLLAATLGARVAPGPRKEIGWFDVTRTEESETDPLLGRAPRTFRALHWHGDVFDLPEGAVSLAHSRLTEHQAFRFGEHAHGLLFHLEAGHSQVVAMTKEFASELREAGVDGDVLVAETPAAVRDAAPIASAVFASWAGRAARRRG
ncbi:MAG TPA: type 1 glutamine amidotransferase [Polyangiaceae bacterium]|jgi:GMP synthase (glutamine-hydrolysing)|nr:type 1 glutamine amidotransferase [Polyangiaceae bacterium]